MKELIIATLILITVPAMAQNAPGCSQETGGQLATDPATGRPYVCDGAGNWIAADSMPHAAVAGTWRFNAQTRLMEYFDGQIWIAVKANITAP